MDIIEKIVCTCIFGSLGIMLVSILVCTYYRKVILIACKAIVAISENINRRRK